MSRCRIIAVVVMLLSGLYASAQQVVIDPSQIAASATNAAEQVDYMLDQLGELAHLGDQMSTLREHIDNVFGEDGIGGKAISVMEDLGTLTRLTEAFNSTINMTQDYAEQLRQLERFRMSDANIMLNYLTTMQDYAEMAVETARKLLGTLGFSKKEKKEELDKIINDLEEKMEDTQQKIQMEVQATIFAEGLTEFIEQIDSQMGADDFVLSKQGFGSAASATSSAIGTISLLFVLAAAFLSAFAYWVFIRGGIAGDPTADEVILRVVTGFLGGMALIRLVTLFTGQVL